MSLSRYRHTAKIAFVGNFQYNCGSSNALLGYTRAGVTLGHDVRVSEFGYVDEPIRSSVPLAKKSWRPDLLVIVYESYPFLSDKVIEQICSFVPRSKRIIIDPDGKYLPPVFFAGGTNHLTSNPYNYWTSLYDFLSDVILQPFIGNREVKNVRQFLYFGVDRQVSELSKQPKDFDLLYVGNNWYRWHDIKWLIETIAPIRSRLKRVALIGQHWSPEVMEGFEEATYSDPIFLKKHRVEIYNSAPYGQVEMTMSRGFLNPIFVRPILNKLQFITPRMFETILADTVPLIPSYFTHASSLYGEEINQLTISSENPAESIVKILENYKKNLKLVKKMRKMLKVKHTYEMRLNELLEYI